MREMTKEECIKIMKCEFNRVMKSNLYEVSMTHSMAEPELKFEFTLKNVFREVENGRL